MLTPVQFSQLAAAAWFGPAATIQASSSTCLFIHGTVSVSYSVYYTLAVPGGAMFGGPAFCTSPFAAVLAAIDAAWVAGAILGAHVEQAQRVVALAEAVFCGAPAPSLAPVEIDFTRRWLDEEDEPERLYREEQRIAHERGGVSY